MKTHLLLCGLLAGLATLPHAFAQTVTWSGPDTGPWHTGANWTPAGVPGANSDVVIDGESGTARTVNLSPGAAVNRLTISAGDTLRVNGNTALQTGAAGYTVQGVLELTGGGDSRLFIPTADTVLEGTGELRMAPGTRLHGGGSLLTRGSIIGAGNIGWNELRVINESAGRIVASVAGQTLAADPRNAGADAGLVNAGRMEAGNGGILQLSGFGGGWFDNTGGIIHAGEGSEVQMVTGAGILGGTLAGEGTGRFRVNGSQSVYWTTLTHEANTVVDNAAWLRTGGTFTNTGSITLQAAANDTRLQMEGPTILTGSGRLVMTGSDNAQVRGGHTLTNTGGHLIEGRGNIGNNETLVFNDPGCTVQANLGGTWLALDPASRDGENLPGFTNKGSLLAKDDGVLVISGFGGGWFDNTGGAMRALDGSEVQMVTNASILNGTLASEGTGLLRVNGSQSVYWTTLTHAANTVVDNAAWLRTSGSLPNSGTITLQANTELSGGGKLVMAGDNRSNARVSGGFLLTNDNHTIEGHGNIGINECAFFNTATGLVSANVAERGLSIDPGGAKLVTNRGILRASNGGDLYLSGFGGGAFDAFFL
jgi:hypothetical protein